jgi:DNA-binding PadR family transcriptional regulator
MSTTRLLILGVIRIKQPVHGYDVRRELLSWQLEEWANVKPGSIYGAIRTLERDGCIAVADRSAHNGRPERTAYVLTSEGEKELFLLLRRTWWTVTQPAEPLVPALALMVFLPRAELISALQARTSQLQGQLSALSFIRASIRDGSIGRDGEIPEHVREIVDFLSARIRAELDWARGYADRLRSGAYQFAGEPGIPELGPGRGWPGDEENAE